MQIKEVIVKASESKKGKQSSGLNKYIKIAAYLIILSLLLGMCMLALSVMPSDFNLMKLLILNIRVLALNTLPLFCIMTVIYFITNRIWVGFSITAVISFLIAEVNRFKLYFRDDGFVFKDVLLIGEAGEMLKSYKLFLDKISIVAIIFIVATIAISIIFMKTEKLHKYVRIAGALIVSLVFLVTYNLFYYDNNKVYQAMWHDAFGTKYKASNNSMARGVIYSFLKSIPSAFPVPPYGYDEQQARDILSKYEDAAIPEEKKVNIISIMFEAYNDLSQFEGVDMGEIDPYENFHNLQQDGYSGNLFTSIFAGDTIKTERAFVTGYGGTDFSNDIESFVNYFKRQGYYTEALHPGYGWFYNRRNVNEYIGYDNFDYYETKYGELKKEDLREPKYNGIISDTDFFDYIMEGYEKATKNGRNYFNFSVTYQNHGPYSDKYISNTNYLVRKEGYADTEFNIINNYLTGIYRTDRAIGRMREFVDGRDEPVVLILFGDHNPLLGDGNTGFEMLGIDLELSDIEGAKNYYQTPYVIYANDAAKKALGKDFKGEGDTISPMFLMNEFFEYAGLEGSAYMNYLSDVKEKYNVINPVYLKRGNKFILRSEAKDLDIIRDRQFVEYYLIRRN